jgi:predicted methyltransferase
MSKFMLAGAVALALSTAAHAAPAPYISAAVADKARPEADVKRDADRKPAEMLAYAGVKPGDKILELVPSGGYFTRIFAKAVGPKGKVYGVYTVRANATAAPPIEGLAAEAAYGNIVPVKTAAYASFSIPEQADIAWTSQNYHDLHNGAGAATVPQTNAQVFKALKPGGVYIVLDHAAAAGTAPDPDDKLHRIDPAVVKREVEAAGFKYEGELTALRNPADDHTKPVFDPSIRGHTDQFIYKFRKPK